MGAQSRFLYQLGFDVEGIDGSETAITHARAWKLGGPIFRTEDITALEHTFPQFDAAIDVCCLQHLTPEEIARAMKEVVRVLKPGGRLFSMTASMGHSPQLFGNVYARPMFNREARMLCETAGLQEVTIETAKYTDKGLTVAHLLIEAQKPVVVAASLKAA